jgi:hypothetical protein
MYPVHIPGNRGVRSDSAGLNTLVTVFPAMVSKPETGALIISCAISFTFSPASLYASMIILNGYVWGVFVGVNVTVLVAVNVLVAVAVCVSVRVYVGVGDGVTVAVLVFVAV